MIKIGQPKVVCENGKSRLVADLIFDGEHHPLWFEVDEMYGKYLTSERSDAFVVGLLHFALREGHDIMFETPMTDRLFEQLTDQFLPAFVKINKLKAIRLIGPLAPEVEHPDLDYRAGGGVSCGVDSLHVFAKHDDITHGCIWNLHGVTSEDETAETRELGWQNLRKMAKEFTSCVGRSLVIGNTNYDRGCVPGLRFDGSSTYGNLFCVLCMQKFWSRYYIASGYAIDEFRLHAGIMADPAHYEYLLLSMVSLGFITFRLDGVAQNRCEKVGDLIKYEPSKKFLAVCWGINPGHSNCTYRCPKCMRTVLDLVAWGALDEYKDRFDVDSYREHQEWYMAELYRGLLQGDPFASEIYPYIRAQKISLRIKLKAVWIVFKKMVRKVLRRGRINLAFRPD